MSYLNQYVSTLLAMDFTNETYMENLMTDAALTFPVTSLISFLQSGLEQQIVEFGKDTDNFYRLIQIIVILKAVIFGVMFVLVYVLVFMGLLSILSDEIWLMKGMINMIPVFVLEGNEAVQKLVCNRKHSAI